MKLCNGQSLSIVPPIEIIANSLQISNFELILMNYSNPAFYNIASMIPISSTFKLYNLFFKSLTQITIFSTVHYMWDKLKEWQLKD